MRRVTLPRMGTAEQLTGVLRSAQFMCANEAELQYAIGVHLDRNRVKYRREVQLPELSRSGPNRVDFLVDRCCIETKVGGGTHALIRQLQRYARSDEIDEFLVITTKSVHTTIPDTIGGKPVTTYLIRTW